MSVHHPSERAVDRQRWVALGLAVLSLLCTAGFVLAPVERPHAVYSWPSAPEDARAVAIPLMLLQPARLAAEIPCDAARAAAPGTTLLSTTTPDPVPGQPPLTGLAVTVGKAHDLEVSSGGTALETQPIPPAGPCRWTITSTPSATTLLRDGRVVDTRTADIRPAVAGVFTSSATPAGMSVSVTADTVFQTSPTLLKIALAAVALLALAAALLLVVRRAGPGRRWPGRRLTLPSLADERGATSLSVGRSGGAAADADAPASDAAPGGRPHRRVAPGPVRLLVDAVVVGVLAVWTVIGPMTIDDGYIAGIIRSRDADGYMGDVYRWFNAPEAPFGWNYEVLDAWSHLNSSTVWMRIPSALLGVLTWLLVGRGLLHRLGPASRRAAGYAVAALLFLLWWLPLNVGLRPESWVAAGVAVVMVLVERGLQRGRLGPVLVALAVAGTTLAVTPTGAVAFLPVLAAAVPVLRLARRSAAGLLAVLATAAAAAATGLLLMFADQSLAAIRLANRIRNDLPGALPWSAEPQRWYLLFATGDVQGPIERRVPLVLALLAVVAVIWRRRRLGDGVRPFADRLLTTAGLSVVVLLFTPTKWTLHFGAFVPFAVALTVLALEQFGRGRGHGGTVGRRVRAVPLGQLAATTAALALVLLGGAQSYAGYNQWAYLSDLAIPWDNIQPQLHGIVWADALLTLAVAVAVLGGVAIVVARAADRTELRVPGWRWLPSPALVAVGLVALTVVLQLGSFVKSTYVRRDTYTLGADALATVRGKPCGLAEDLSVETDPSAGLLQPSPLPSGDGSTVALDGFTTVTDGAVAGRPALRMAGQELPGWSATGHRDAAGTGPATARTGWFQLPADVRDGAVPLVVTQTGDRTAGSNVVAEFGVVRGNTIVPVGARGLPDPGGAPAARDSRLVVSGVSPAPDAVRLVLTDGAAATSTPLAVSVPRAPHTRPLSQVVPSRQPALVDWPVAYVFPCQELGVQVDGRTDVPQWRIAAATPSTAGDIIVAGFVGGPYTAAYSLVDQQEVPVYLRNRPLERPVSLFSWHARVPTVAPRTQVGTETVSGLAR